MKKIISLFISAFVVLSMSSCASIIFNDNDGDDRYYRKERNRDSSLYKRKGTSRDTKKSSNSDSPLNKRVD